MIFVLSQQILVKNKVSVFVYDADPTKEQLGFIE